MTTFVFANNVKTTLASALSTTATTITLASSTNLPSSIPAGEYFVITLNDAATQNVFEVCYATAVSGNTLTVLRGQEGTSPQSWLVGDFAFSTVTAGQMESFSTGGLTNPMTTVGDIITATTGGTPVRLAAGTSGYVLTSTGPGSPIEWAPGGGGSSGVTSFNTRTGAVTLTATDVDDALGYTPFSTAGGTITGPVLLNAALSCTGNVTSGSNITANGSIGIGGSAWSLTNSSGTLEFFSVNGTVATLSSSGNFVASGTIQAGSDRRIKENVHPITDALSKVREGLVGVEYNRIDQGGRKEAGFIAQDVANSLPHLVTVSKVGQMDDFHSLAYMHLTAYLAAAIVELHDTVLRQQAEIDALKVK